MLPSLLSWSSKQRQCVFIIIGAFIAIALSLQLKLLTNESIAATRTTTATENSRQPDHQAPRGASSSFKTVKKKVNESITIKIDKCHFEVVHVKNMSIATVVDGEEEEGTLTLYRTILSRPPNQELHYFNDQTRGYDAHIYSFVPICNFNNSFSCQPNNNNNKTRDCLLAPSATTVVTAYFDIKSKYPGTWYDGWMQTMLSLRDSMIIFTTHDKIYQMARARSRAPHSTILVALDSLEDVGLARTPPFENNATFWNHQIAMDPWKRKHGNHYYLYLIWLSKPWFVMEAIHWNWFQSDFFTWTDIGCFRNQHAAKRFSNRTMVQYPQVVPAQRLAVAAIKQPILRDYIVADNDSNITNKNATMTLFHYSPWDDDKFGQNSKYFYQSASLLAANTSVWKRFQRAHLYTLRGFIDRNLFLGEDQIVLQVCCRLFGDALCTYAMPGQVGDNKYFFLRTILQQGKLSFRWWTPPPAPTVASPINERQSKTTIVNYNLSEWPSPQDLHHVFGMNKKWMELKKSKNVVIDTSVTHPTWLK